MRIADYSLTTKDVVILWEDHDGNPVVLKEPKSLRFSHFTLENLKTGYCGSSTKLGQFSCIFGDFYLKRESTIYIISVYVPCSMFVMLSWISFWLGPSISARLSLTLTLLLTMTTQIQGANQNLPQVSHHMRNMKYFATL